MKVPTDPRTPSRGNTSVWTIALLIVVVGVLAWVGYAFGLGAEARWSRPHSSVTFLSGDLVPLVSQLLLYFIQFF
jgi:hypothetical protein